MLYLKEINLADADKEYEYLTALPADENGFTNPDHGVSREDFHRVALPRLIGYAAGVGLPEGFVPMSSFLLWEDDRIVGLFRVRQRLNDALREAAGTSALASTRRFGAGATARAGWRCCCRRRFASCRRTSCI